MFGRFCLAACRFFASLPPGASPMAAQSSAATSEASMTLLPGAGLEILLFNAPFPTSN
jgi:hypothetical protein